MIAADRVVVVGERRSRETPACEAPLVLAIGDAIVPRRAAHAIAEGRAAAARIGRAPRPHACGVSDLSAVEPVRQPGLGNDLAREREVLWDKRGWRRPLYQRTSALARAGLRPLLRCGVLARPWRTADGRPTLRG